MVNLDALWHTRGLVYEEIDPLQAIDPPSTLFLFRSYTKLRDTINRLGISLLQNDREGILIQILAMLDLPLQAIYSISVIADIAIFLVNRVGLCVLEIFGAGVGIVINLIEMGKDICSLYCTTKSHRYYQEQMRKLTPLLNKEVLNTRQKEELYQILEGMDQFINVPSNASLSFIRRIRKQGIEELVSLTGTLVPLLRSNKSSEVKAALKQAKHLVKNIDKQFNKCFIIHALGLFALMISTAALIASFLIAPPITALCISIVGTLVYYLRASLIPTFLDQKGYTISLMPLLPNWLKNIGAVIVAKCQNTSPAASLSSSSS